jgi:indolepyruvate ferredoxin oxidoreductase, alpha subunit
MPELDKALNFFSGDEAVGRGAFEAGVRVAASYPGTPATEILEYLSGFPEVDSQWSVNEKVAYEVAYGAALSGSRSIFSAKHVGFNVAMDSIMTSAYIGVNAGFVAVTCDDPGLHSSQNEQDNRLLSQLAKMPLLEPSSPQEAYEFTKLAFEISEEFDTPVLIRLTTRIAHTKENFPIADRADLPKKKYVTNIPKNVMVPGNAFRRHIALEEKLLRLKEYSEGSALNRIEMGKKDIGFITDSVSYLYLKENYPDASILKLGFTYPFPDEKIRSFAKKVKKVFVLEELEPFIENHVRSLGIKTSAKDQSWRVGELRPEDIPLVVKGEPKPRKQGNARRPVLCPGCMHRPVFTVLRKNKIIVTGDIGCYTLGALEPLSALHTCLCMGSSVTLMEGFYRSLGKGVAGVIGDSTFVHSGIPGLINAAYNGVKGTLFILDNGTTAMTGSQPHPGTGVNARGEKTKRLSLEEICRACGADLVEIVTNPFDLNALDKLVKECMSRDALSVIIARYPCRIIHRERAKPVIFLKEKCKKCGLCLAIDCPALSKDAEGYIGIDTSICTGCYLCANTCAFGALKKDSNE